MVPDGCQTVPRAALTRAPPDGRHPGPALAIAAGVRRRAAAGPGARPISVSGGGCGVAGAWPDRAGTRSRSTTGPVAGAEVDLVRPRMAPSTRGSRRRPRHHEPDAAGRRTFLRVPLPVRGFRPDTRPTMTVAGSPRGTADPAGHPRRPLRPGPAPTTTGSPRASAPWPARRPRSPLTSAADLGAGQGRRR